MSARSSLSLLPCSNMKHRNSAKHYIYNINLLLVYFYSVPSRISNIKENDLCTTKGKEDYGN